MDVVDSGNVATSSGTKISLKFPPPGEEMSVNVLSDSQIDLTGIDLEKAEIDILGNDLIISDPETGAQLILVGAVLYLFDEDSLLSFYFDGVSINSQELLSKIGEVGNLSVKDFIEISTILPENNSTSAQDGEGNPAEGKKSSEEEETEISEAQMLLISAAVDNAQYRTEPVDEKVSDLELEFTSNSASTAIDEIGTFENLQLSQLQALQ